MKPYVQVAQSCLTLCIPMDCSPPGSPVQGIFHARILQKVAISYSRGSSDPGIEPASLVSPALAGGFFTTSTTLPVTKLYLLGHSYFLCVCGGGDPFLYIYGHFHVIGILSPLCSLLNYFKENLRISINISFHWKRFKCCGRNLLCLSWKPVFSVKLRLCKKPAPHCLTAYDEDIVNLWG